MDGSKGYHGSQVLPAQCWAQPSVSIHCAFDCLSGHLVHMIAFEWSSATLSTNIKVTFRLYATKVVTFEET